MNSERNENPGNPQNNLGLGQRFRDYCSNYQPQMFNYGAMIGSAAMTGKAINEYINFGLRDAVWSACVGLILGIVQFIEPYDIENGNSEDSEDDDYDE